MVLFRGTKLNIGCKHHTMSSNVPAPTLPASCFYCGAGANTYSLYHTGARMDRFHCFGCSDALRREVKEVLARQGVAFHTTPAPPARNDQQPPQNK